MENTLPVVVGAAAVVGAAFLAYTQFGGAKDQKLQEEALVKLERAFDQEKEARDATPGTTDVALPRRIAAPALVANDENARRYLVESLQKHGFAIIQVRLCALFRR